MMRAGAAGTVGVAQQRHRFEQAGRARRALEVECVEQCRRELPHGRPSPDQFGPHIHGLRLGQTLGLCDRVQEPRPADGAVDGRDRVDVALMGRDDGTARARQNPEMDLRVAQGAGSGLPGLALRLAS
jgi:hypothetical protein